MNLDLKELRSKAEAASVAIDDELKDREEHGMPSGHPGRIKAVRQFTELAGPEVVLALLDRIDEMHKHLELALSFCPTWPAPAGLAPMFYYTLSYEFDAEIQNKIDAAREALKKYAGDVE